MTTHCPAESLTALGLRHENGTQPPKGKSVSVTITNFTPDDEDGVGFDSDAIEEEQPEREVVMITSKVGAATHSSPTT